jgi:hypothetical protein
MKLHLPARPICAFLALVALALSTACIIERGPYWHGPGYYRHW